jgi:photosystem II stability/assembly factor-like uncharacterized protein
MRDEIELLKAFRADTPAPTATAWTRAEQAIAAARHQATGRPASRLLSRFPGFPRWRVLTPRWRGLTALSTVLALAAAILVAVTLHASPTASQGKTAGPSANADSTLTWSLAGYLVPKGWQLDTHGPVPGRMTCPTATTCYVQGATTGLYVSTDGARTWRAIRLPSGLTFTSVLVCQTSATCEAGAMEHGQPAFTVTRDGGGEIATMSCLSTTTCRALTLAPGQKSPFHAHLVTTDDGLHFTTTAFPAVDSILALSCPTASHCIAAGLGPVFGGRVAVRTGAVLLSDDGGATWRPGTLPRGVQLGGPIKCIGAERCFVIGTVIRGHGTLYDELMVSDDGGATWTERPISPRFPDPGIDDLACVSASTCYITGSDAVSEHFDNGTATSGGSSFAAVTYNAGLTWQAIGFPEPSSLPRFEPPDVFMTVSSLQCPKVNTCIALADWVAGNKYAAIYRTAP